MKMQKELDLVVNASTGTTTDLRQNTAIMTEYILLPIAVFAGLLIMGVVAGTIVYFLRLTFKIHHPLGRGAPTTPFKELRCIK